MTGPTSRHVRAALVCFAALLAGGGIPGPAEAAEGPVSADAAPATGEEAPAATPGPQPAESAGSPAIVPGQSVLDLAEAKRLAIADNPSLKAAEARVKQARARVQQARGLWYPQLDLQASAANTWLSERDYERARQAAIEPFYSSFVLGTQARLQGQLTSNVAAILSAITGLQTGGQGQGGSSPLMTHIQIASDLGETIVRSTYQRQKVDDSLESYTVSLMASWIVFNGFDRRFANAEAKFGELESEAALDEAHRLLLSAVAQAYYAAQLARENIRIAQEDEKFNLRLLEEAKARRRVGTGSKSDQLNFEVRVNAARNAVIQAQRDYDTARIALAQLLAFPDSEFPATMELAPLDPESIEELEKPEPGPLVQTAKAKRPDLRVGEMAVKRTNAGLGRSRSAFYPQVIASASKDAVRTDDREFRADDFSTTVGVQISYKLFAGGRNLARVREAKALRTEAEYNLADTELQVAADVRSALEELEAAQQQVVLQRANAVYVQQNRDLVELAYKGGVEPVVRLNEAQRDLVAAQGNLAFARVQLRQAWHNLRTATAETLDPYTEQAEDAASP